MAVAVINDDSTDVGYVHLGIVHIVYVADDAIASGRDGIVGAEFVSMSEAAKNPAAYESWSSFCIENLDALLAKAAAIAPDRKVA
jgi:predicted NUDIX family phosphoesterase